MRTYAKSVVPLVLATLAGCNEIADPERDVGKPRFDVSETFAIYHTGGSGHEPAAVERAVGAWQHAWHQHDPLSASMPTIVYQPSGATLLQFQNHGTGTLYGYCGEYPVIYRVRAPNTECHPTVGEQDAVVVSPDTASLRRLVMHELAHHGNLGLQPIAHRADQFPVLRDCVSSVTAEGANDAFCPHEIQFAFWKRNLRDSVSFATALVKALNIDGSTFVQEGNSIPLTALLDIVGEAPDPPTAALNIQWNSEIPSYLAVSGSGTGASATGISPGASTVHASIPNPGSNLYAYVPFTNDAHYVTVTAPPPAPLPPGSYIIITPSPVSISPNTSYSATASATAYNASHQVISGATFDWTTDDGGVAYGYANSTASVYVYGGHTGTTILRARAGTVEGTATVNVSCPGYWCP
jgi:hypothetical protein